MVEYVESLEKKLESKDQEISRMKEDYNDKVPTLEFEIKELTD